MMAEATPVCLPGSIDELEALDIPTLRRIWIEVLGNARLRRTGRDLMVRAIAYHMQEQRHGGLSPATRRRLAGTDGNGVANRPPAATLKPGTRLLRQWHGVIHEVIVLEAGVRYGGKTWRSLSAVAREITGTRWSGPRFFGLQPSGLSPSRTSPSGTERSASR